MPGQPTAHQIAFLRRLQQSHGPISYREAFAFATDAFRGARPSLEGDVWLPYDHRLWLDAVAAHGWIDLVDDDIAPDDAIEITERGLSVLAGESDQDGTRMYGPQRSTQSHSGR